MKQKHLLRHINKEIRESIGGIKYRSSNLNKYTSSNPLKQYFINRFLKNILETVERCRVEKIIEIGCGEGFIIRCLMLNTDFNISGCDVSEKAVKFAKLINPGVRFLVADINSLPIESGAYDLVISCEVLEHLQEPYIALKEIKRVSKGLCLISVPHEPYFSIMNFFSGKTLIPCGNAPVHLQRWTKREFKELLAKEFEIISVSSSLPWLIALCRINKKSTR